MSSVGAQTVVKTPCLGREKAVIGHKSSALFSVPSSPKPAPTQKIEPNAPARSRTWIYRLGGTIAERARGSEHPPFLLISVCPTVRELPVDTPSAPLSASGKLSTARYTTPRSSGGSAAASGCCPYETTRRALTSPSPSSWFRRHILRT